MSHLREGGKWILGMVLLLGGCCSSDCCPRLEPPSLPIVERGRLVLDVSALPPVDSSSRPELYPKTIYQKLTAEECACRAGQTAGLAAVLQQEQQARGCSGSCHGCLGGRKRSRLSETILALSADEARNKVVGEALETFYQLAEAEARMDLLQESLDEALALQRDTEQRVKRKLQKATDLDAVQKLASETRSDMGQLRQTRAQLNEHLKSLIGVTHPDAHPIWPEAALKVVPEEIDEAKAIEVGLACRADLQLFRRVLEDLDTDTLPVVRQLLGGLSPLLAGAVHGPCQPPWVACLRSLLASLCGSQKDVESVREQVRLLLAERERQVVREIREAIARICERVRLVALARQRDELAHTRVHELQIRQDKGQAVWADLSRAQLDWDRARGDVIHAAIDWESARVQLSQAQGLLAPSCPPGCRDMR